jgi:hypothetical protein
MSETPQTKQNKTKLNKRKEDNTAKKFIPPVVEEVSKYCSDRKNNVDAETFIAHYASKGWMIGNSKMKDWKSAIITWEKRNKKSANEKLLEEKGESFFDGFR